MKPNYPSGPSQLAAIERWPDYTVKPQDAIERWPDYTVKPNYPSGPSQLAAIERWPDYTVKPGHPSAGCNGDGCNREVA